MPATRRLSVTTEIANIVRDKVASGEYASESDVVRDGLRALQERDDTLDGWLRTEVLSGLDAYQENPSQGLTLADVRADLDRRHHQAGQPS